MFRDILSGSRAIFIGIVFFVLVVGGSLLYSWHVHRTTDAELAETQRKVQPLESKNETHTAAGTVNTSTTDFEQVGTDLETDDLQVSDDTGMSPIDETSEALDVADAFLPDDFVSEEAPVEEVPVSPFGFGPYPEVPIGFPENLMPSWTWSEDKRQNYEPNLLKDFELMGRVLIKLWKQGDQDFRGVIRDDTNGKVYPLYPDRAYVTWRELKDENGKILFQYAGNLTAADGFPPLSFRDFMEGTVPTGIRFIERETSGIDPYQFLNLRRR